MDIKNIMIDNVITVESNTSVKDAVNVMNQHEIGCLVVKEMGKIVGIITERDILSRVVANCKHPEKTKVSEVMSSPVIVGSVDMDIKDAVKQMLTRKIKKLPIVENGQLVGLITLTDIARMFSVHIPLE